MGVDNLGPNQCDIPIRIRPATVDDSPGLAHVQVDSYRTAYAGLFPWPHQDRPRPARSRLRLDGH